MKAQPLTYKSSSQVFHEYIRTVNELQLTKESNSLSSAVQAALLRLPPLYISPKTHTIQEWGILDHGEWEPGHRHVSYFLGLYPGSTITPSKTPELAAAAAETLRRRTSHGGGHTGWSRAWLVGLYARLRMPQEVEANITALFKDSTLPNMLDSHPPFQIDGNFGGTAGITEALVQSHEEVEIEGEGEGEGSRSQARALVPLIRLLPACPASWSSGKIRGVKARGGFELDFEWQDRRIVSPVTIRSILGKDAILCLHRAGCNWRDETEAKESEDHWHWRIKSLRDLKKRMAAEADRQ